MLDHRLEGLRGWFRSGLAFKVHRLCVSLDVNLGVGVGEGLEHLGLSGGGYESSLVNLLVALLVNLLVASKFTSCSRHLGVGVGERLEQLDLGALPEEHYYAIASLLLVVIQLLVRITNY